MSADLQALEDAARDFERDADLDFVDPRRLSAVIDRLQGALCTVVSRGRKRGDHLLAGQSACSWVANQCQMSKTTAADRLCVGDTLSKLPKIGGRASSGALTRWARRCIMRWAPAPCRGETACGRTSASAPPSKV